VARQETARSQLAVTFGRIVTKSLTDTPDPTAVLERVCGAEYILWLTGKYFSNESLKLVTMQILNVLPYYQRQNTDLEKGLKLVGDLGPVSLPSDINILIYNNNAGCREVAEEVRALAIEDGGLIRPYIIGLDDLEAYQDDTRKVLLFYTNENTFQQINRVHRTLQCALDLGIDIVMVQEQDLKKGACDFSHTIRQTPPELVVNGLYNNLAVPLYELAEYRKISLRQILLTMGAKPIISR